MIIGGLMPRSQAVKPFCSSCGRWYEPSGLATMAGLDAAQAKQLVESDDVSRLKEAVALPEVFAPHLAIKFMDCKGCDLADTAAELVAVGFQKKGKQHIKKEKSLGVYMMPRADARLVARQMQAMLDRQAQQAGGAEGKKT